MEIQANTMLAFVNGQREHIETEVYETVYPEVQYASLIPVDNSAPEWTQTVTFKSKDIYGKADWVNGNADDINLAGTTAKKSQSSVEMAGIGYGYGYEELMVSMQNGVDLNRDDAVAARETYEHFVDKIAFIGDETKGFKGLINNDGVTTVAATKTFLTATESEILKDINSLISGTASATNNTMPADTLLLPLTQFNYLASTPLTNNSGGTLLSFIQQYNTYTALTGQQLTIRAVGKLENGGTGGTINRAMAYSRNPRVLKLHIPMPLKFLETQPSGVLNFVVPGIFRLGGVEIRNTDAVRYMDGV
ncbi:DUF2184 domain-containing protein [Psychrobacter glaciei]|uniref:DUF2184 domain-containing protein n=1 Tax=Psychrobacter glaciei TaxID=619771 RepID=UPI003F46C0AB